MVERQFFVDLWDKVRKGDPVKVGLNSGFVVFGTVTDIKWDGKDYMVLKTETEFPTRNKLWNHDTGLVWIPFDSVSFVGWVKEDCGDESSNTEDGRDKE